MMKIGIDLTSLLYGRGVSRYTSSLFTALSEEPDIKLFGYASSHRGQKKLYQELKQLESTLSPSQQKIFQKNLTFQKFSPKLNWLFWHYLKINPIKKAMPKIDLFHSWDYLQPPDNDLPLVSTIHDLAILKFPHIAHPEVLAHHRQSWKILKRKNAHLIVVSQHTKDDVINLLGFPEHHVHLVYEALPLDAILPTEQLNKKNFLQLRQKYTLNKDYFLFVGNREPRKNLQRLIEAWWPLREKIDLVLVGAKGWNEPKLKHPNLKILQHIDNYDLGLLYNFAQALTYPSLEEGFGLPILEAYAYHTPVVTSLYTATAEVAGEAGVLVDPYSIKSINQGLQTILNETKLQRQARQEKMNKQLHKFSWKKAAKATVKVYQKALEDHHA